MASENAKIDENRVKTLTGVTDDVAAEIKRLLIDPVTGRLKVSAVISGIGSTSSASGQTTDATQTTIGTVAIDAGKTYFIIVKVLAQEDSESDRAVFHLEGLFHRPTAGNVIKQGNTNSVTTIRSDSDWQVEFNANAATNEVEVKVTGKAGTTIDWSTNINYFSI